MIIAVDFDGTIVDHRFPDIGRESPGAIRWMKAWQEAGAKLILFTMRSDLHNPSDNGSGPTPGANADQPYLLHAVEWCRERGVTFWGVNENPDQKSWTQSPKPYAHLYVDDAAFGCPLRDHPDATSKKKCVDWAIVGPAVFDLIGA